MSLSGGKKKNLGSKVVGVFLLDLVLGCFFLLSLIHADQYKYVAHFDVFITLTVSECRQHLLS